MTICSCSWLVSLDLPYASRKVDENVRISGKQIRPADVERVGLVTNPEFFTIPAEAKG